MNENKKTPQEQSREELYLREILEGQSREKVYLKEILEQTVKTNRHLLVVYILVSIMFVCGVMLPILFPQ